jgi:hypothetical protein
MGWVEDALAAQGMGQNLTIFASAGTGYEGGVTLNYSLKVSSNVSEITLSTKVTPGVDADYKVTGNNITPSEGTVENDDVFIIEVPPGATEIEILFQFNGVGYDIEDGPMGSLTFDDVQISDSVLQGDLFRFGSSAGVRVINKAMADEGYFPVFGDSEGLFVKRGIVSKKRKMNLGIICL